MVSSTRQAIACLLVIFGVVVAAHAQTTPVKEPTSTVSGRITIKDKAAPGIAVGLRLHDESRPQPVTHRAVTDVNGEYRMTNVPAGTYWVAVSAPAFVFREDSASEKTLIVNKGETIDNVDFILVRGGVITGKITDAEGRPLIQQAVQIMPENMGNGRIRYFGHVQTDDRGIYRAFGLSPGAYKVSAGSGDDDSFAARYQPAHFRRTYYPNVSDPAQAKAIQVSEGSEATNVDIVLGRTITTYTASGRIVDEAGQPVPNIPFSITHFVDQNSTHTMSSGAVSNARGEFSFEKLTPGSYAATIRAEGNSDFRADQVRFEITDADVSGLVITVQKAGSVSGVVVIEGGDDKAMREHLRVTGVSVVMANAVSERGGWGHFARFADDGSFRIGGLPAGTATFHISSSSRFRIVRIERDGVIQPRGVEIRERENVTGIRLIATYANGSIKGTIQVQNGTLPANAQFSVWLVKIGEDPHLSQTSNGTQVDARGQFVIQGLMPGNYVLNTGVYIPGTRENPHKKQEIVVTNGVVTPVTVTLDLSSVTNP